MDKYQDIYNEYVVDQTVPQLKLTPTIIDNLTF